MNIYSPSYKRSEGVKTHKLIPDVIYCVAEFEEKTYKDKGYNVVTMPDEVQGNISRVRNWMLDNVIKNKGLIIDDDIEALRIWTEEGGLPKVEDIDDIDEFIDKGFDLCDQFDCRLWGLNIIGDKGGYREYTPFALKSSISGSFMGFLNNELRFDERIPLKEDYDYCVQNCNTYRKLLRLNYAHMVKKDHLNVGGCADSRTLQAEKDQMTLFVKKWGSKIVQQDKGAKGYDINPIVKIPIGGV